MKKLFIAFLTGAMSIAFMPITSIYASNDYANIKELFAETTLTIGGEVIEDTDNIIITKTKHKENVNRLSFFSDNKEYQTEYEVSVPMTCKNNGECKVADRTGITPLTNETVSKTDSYITATISLDYTLNSKRDKINITRFSATWNSSNKYIGVTNRHVLYGVWGYAPGGYVGEYRPSNNSFTTYPKWGYGPKYPNTDYTICGARSTAQVTMYGSTANSGVVIELTIRVD